MPCKYTEHVIFCGVDGGFTVGRWKLPRRDRHCAGSPDPAQAVSAAASIAHPEHEDTAIEKSCDVTDV